mgnify:CR=1 FL=1
MDHFLQAGDLVGVSLLFVKLVFLTSSFAVKCR